MAAGATFSAGGMMLKAGGSLTASMLTGFAVGAGTGAASGAAGSAIYQGITAGQVNKEQVKLAAISTGAGLAAAGAAAPALGIGNKAVSKVLGKVLQKAGMKEALAAGTATVACMAGEGTLLGGMMAGAGDIAAQGYNIHAGNQAAINWKQTAKSTFTGAAGGFLMGGAFGMFSLTKAGSRFFQWLETPTKIEQNAAKGIKQFLGDNRGTASIEALLGKSEKKVDFYVTKDGVIIKNSIPENLIENPFRNGNYGIVNNETGKFEEVLRIDPATPKGQKGPSYSHYHINKGKEHLSPRPGDSNPLGY